MRSSRSGSEVVAGASLERLTSHTCVNMLFLVEKVESRPDHAIVCQRLPRGAPHVRRLEGGGSVFRAIVGSVHY